jgi:hypothetical protein
MAAQISSPLAVDEDTFEGRWARWVADGRNGDETLHRPAVGAIVLVASALLIALLRIVTLA